MNTHKTTEENTFKEVQNRIDYFFLQTDGTYDFPNSKEGDLLRLVHETIPKALTEAEARGMEEAVKIIEKYEKMPFAPTTFARIKASLTPKNTGEEIKSNNE